MFRVDFRALSSLKFSTSQHISVKIGSRRWGLFLLANGSGASTYGNSPTCNGSTVAGIGRDKAAAIWFAALNQYIISTETYAKARILLTYQGSGWQR